MDAAQFADVKNVSKALSAPRARLEWLLRFAESDPEDLTPGERVDERLVLTGFLLSRSEVIFTLDAATLASDDEISEARSRLSQLFADLKTGREIQIASPVAYKMMYHEDTHEVIEIYSDDVSRVDRLFNETLKMLTQFAPNIRQCSAPKPRSKEKCGKWFVGRPDQRFCSSTCQVRQATREMRQRQQPAVPKKRGRPRKDV